MNDPPEASPGSDAPTLSTVAGLTPLWSMVIRDLSALSEARRDIASSLGGSTWPATTVDDLLLATTELVVNALTHGDAGAVDVVVGVIRESQQLAVVTRHVDRGVGELLDTPTMAAPDQISGRGRAVVAAVADGYDVVHRPDNEVLHVVRFAV
jgi:anti-sigma regulatory factor (Ser/Thr protein kinase)